MTTLTDNLRSECSWCTPCSDCQTLMGAAADEIERLQALVDQIPKSADGVPLAGDGSVWLAGSRGEPFEVRLVPQVVIRYPDGEVSPINPGRLFASREAAEKARTADVR